MRYVECKLLLSSNARSFDTVSNEFDEFLFAFKSATHSKRIKFFFHIDRIIQRPAKHEKYTVHESQTAMTSRFLQAEMLFESTCYLSTPDRKNKKKEEKCRRAFVSDFSLKSNCRHAA